MIYLELFYNVKYHLQNGTFYPVNCLNIVEIYKDIDQYK
jgi:hypothetical protein